MSGSPEQNLSQMNGVPNLGLNFENFVEQSLANDCPFDPDDDYTRYLSQYGLS